jgi:acyl-CoA thioesterase FadM
MNLYLRLLYTLLVSYVQGKGSVFDEHTLKFRTWPHDLDLNFHMNNGRYLTLMDLGRVQFVIRAGLMRRLLDEGWMPVIGGVQMRFYRSILPLQKFELKTKVLSWDDKWVYFNQTFHVSGELMASGTVRALVRSKEGTVPVGDLLLLIGAPSQPPAPPPNMPF